MGLSVLRQDNVWSLFQPLASILLRCYNRSLLLSHPWRSLHVFFLQHFISWSDNWDNFHTEHSPTVCLLASGVTRLKRWQKMIGDTRTGLRPSCHVVCFSLRGFERSAGLDRRVKGCWRTAWRPIPLWFGLLFSHQRGTVTHLLQCEVRRKARCRSLWQHERIWQFLQIWQIK